MKITLLQIKCHLITIYCFILMIQSYYNINNAKTLRYINVCIWSTYEGRVEGGKKRTLSKNCCQSLNIKQIAVLYDGICSSCSKL